VKIALRIGWILLCLILALAARSWNLRDVFIEGRIYFVDADCYSRMSRVAIIAEHPGTIVRHHDFENWPQGVTPHTTAPLDYLILAVKGVLDLGFAVMDAHQTSVLHNQTLDLAGAIVSPLLGLGGTLFLAFWVWKFRVRYGGMALLLYAISPILVHGTLLGRPDHQSLLIFLLTIVAGSELALAAPTLESESTSSKRAWGVVAGVAWALSLWVSWYEPLILLVVVTVLWVIADRKALWSLHRRPGAVVGLVILAVFLGLEGWRVTMPDSADRAHFAQWARSIGELAHLDLLSPLLGSWLGWTVFAAPVLLYLARKSDRRALPLLALLAVVLALTVWQVRWGYFLALVFVWGLPWQMQVIRRPWVAWLVFVASLWPVLKDWDARLYPDELAEDRLSMHRAEIPALRDLVMATARENAGPILAPWWLSPSIAYWTGNPCVAGSSHQSLPGIVDTARFFLSISPDSSAAILRSRRVRWVLVDEPARVIANSSSLLAMEPPLEPLAATLMEHPDEVPDFLQEWKGAEASRSDGLRFYRLYRVDDAKLPP
jgi:hypothetical protein